MPSRSISDLEPWVRAAQIAAEARDAGAAAARPGVRRIEVADVVESMIRSRGAEPAFPTNLSRNVEAAHFTPADGDDVRFEAGDLVKVDVGAHLDGAIADTAVTVEVGGGRRHEALRKAVTEAVNAGIAHVRAGGPVDDVSRAIEAAAAARGFKTVENLTGHTIERYLLHAGKAVPNVAGMSGERFEEGEIVAIEPFVTNGEGRIENGPFGNIYRFRRDPGEVDPSLAPWFEKFRTLPFTMRWVPDADARQRIERARRVLQTYPVFVEVGGGLVTQAEHTVLVTSDGARVLTASPAST